MIYGSAQLDCIYIYIYIYVFKCFNHPSRAFHHDLQHLLYSKNATGPWIPRSKTTKMWRDAARTWPWSLPERTGSWCVMFIHYRKIFTFQTPGFCVPWLLDSTQYTKPRSPADFATLAVDPWETPRQLFWWLVSAVLGLKLSPSLWNGNQKISKDINQGSRWFASSTSQLPSHRSPDRSLLASLPR